MLMTNCLLRKCPKKHQSTEIIHYYCPLELPFIAHRLQTMKNDDDKLLIKEMSKKASVHRNHPLLLSIRTSVHCTSSANNEKRRRQKEKKRFVWLLSRLFNRMFFHCFCKCVLHVHTCIFIYLNCRNYVLSLFKKNIKSAKRQNL